MLPDGPFLALELRMHVRAYIYIYIHACMHAYIHTYIRTYIHTYIHTHTHIIHRIYAHPTTRSSICQKDRKVLENNRLTSSVALISITAIGIVTTVTAGFSALPLPGLPVLLLLH